MNRKVKWNNVRPPISFDVEDWGVRIFDMGLELSFVTGELSTGCLFFGLPLGVYVRSNESQDSHPKLCHEFFP